MSVVSPSLPSPPLSPHHRFFTLMCNVRSSFILYKHFIFSDICQHDDMCLCVVCVRVCTVILVFNWLMCLTTYSSTTAFHVNILTVIAH